MENFETPEYRDQKYNHGADHRHALAARLFNMLDGAGFIFADRRNAGEELIASRAIGPRVKIVVYTTITGGSHVANKLTLKGLICRPRGDDAIRVALVSISPRGRYTGAGERTGPNNYGLDRFMRINRVGHIGGQGGIVDRTLCRMRDAFRKAQDLRFCRCGAPRAQSQKTERIRYCSDFCWNRDGEGIRAPG